jgi:L-aminopeptidase/D-esterase-like protein
MSWRQISITELDGIRIGNAQNMEAMTGVTVILFDEPNTGGIDVSGGGPASREPYLLSPLMDPKTIHALVLSGGSAYGLDASTGVMRYLEEHGVGYPIGNTIVPLVCQSCIFDLRIGNPLVRPDAQMGYDACVDAEKNQPQSGIIGAGTGATVGKLLGIEQAQKSGMGYFALQVGELKIGAVAVVNALGDIFDYKNGKKVAGVLNKDRTQFLDVESEMCCQHMQWEKGANTTLGAIFTNADLTHAQMSKVASMARAGFARSIHPVGTLADGDTIYAFAVDGKVQADINLVGSLASTALAEAILDGVSKSSMAEEKINRTDGRS